MYCPVTEKKEKKSIKKEKKTTSKANEHERNDKSVENHWTSSGWVRDSERQKIEQLDNLISRIPISTCIMWSYSYCQYVVLFNSSLIMSN
jgi:uncharacterized Zn finger protein (UPF0148 family)